MEYVPETFKVPEVDVSVMLVWPFSAMILSVKSMRSDVLLGSGIVILTFKDVTSSEIFKLWHLELTAIAEAVKDANIEA